VSWSGRSAAPGCTSRASARWLRGALAGWLGALACAASAQWLPIAGDGIHDPRSPAVGVLQEPGSALSRLPRDTAGNQVNWVRALEENAIEPRANLQPGTEVRVLETDILLSLKGGLPMVRFPHRQHTLWLDCRNCHETPFKSRIGANRLSMFQMLQGEQCGICHGAVAFPLTECARCHNTPRAPAAKP
jgi:c(7)-type cytochrome triheme protein